jgi:nucleoside-diphosphate-sugar epimerase
VVGATVAKVIGATDGKIIVWGEGKEERDLLYIDDLVQFVELSLDRQRTPFELCNVGYGKSISVRSLVHNIVRLSGRKLDVQYDPSQPSINTKLCLNIEKAAEIFGWMPRISLERGLEKTLDWYCG